MLLLRTERRKLLYEDAYEVDYKPRTNSKRLKSIYGKYLHCKNSWSESALDNEA
jgi:hypothetical protein